MKTIRTLLALLACMPLLASHAASPREAADLGMEGYRLFVRDSLPDDRSHGYSMMLEAAWEGDAKSANNIGWLMQHGDFAEKDLPGALRWYERAADQGLPAAALNYAGLIFQHPEALGGKQADIERVANAALTAGTALATGRGLHYDYRQGENLIMRAALLGNEKAAMTIAQQLEMYPDSFSYLDLKEIVKECETLLPSGRHILPMDLSRDDIDHLLLSPSFWYGRTSPKGDAP